MAGAARWIRPVGSLLILPADSLLMEDALKNVPTEETWHGGREREGLRCLKNNPFYYIR